MSEGQLLDENPDRFFYYNLQFPEVEQMYKDAQLSFWTADEVDLQKDEVDWRTNLDEKEKQFLKIALGFFAGADGIVNENLATRFYKECQVPEVRAFYAFQIAIEQIHSDMYARMITSLIPSHEERMELFQLCQSKTSAIGAKANWAQRWMADDAPFRFRVVAFACVEGIFFSSSFCAIYYFKKTNKMPGLAKANELISRDEGSHQDFACLLITLFNLLPTSADREQAIEIVREAIQVEKEFVNEALPVAMIGMNAEEMMEYVECVADHLLQNMGLEECYGTPNPFPWMELISLQNKNNFFESRTTEYQKSGTRSFSLTADF